ncbi:hypothetical protein Golax_002389 [Gossypium laxum]|uniref:Reverse transcriptase zinc-binding domain-containing protein n=1 Tax=Gossypium laxum TaxID=34288 RepID=A0A7J9AR26_9ROSI|nr:hypothetical protein [Gossypium laxum]
MRVVNNLNNYLGLLLPIAKALENGFDDLDDDSLCHSLLTDNERKVKDLWNYNHTDWNRERMIELFRSLNFEKKCPRCEANEETLIYTLKDCPSARAILTLEGFDNQLLDGKEEMLEWCGRGLRLSVMISESTTLLISRGLKWKGGIGVIARDSDGFVIRGSDGFEVKTVQAKWA